MITIHLYFIKQYGPMVQFWRGFFIRDLRPIT